MKKRYKFLIAAATMVAIPAAINHYIKKNFSSPFSPKYHQLTYDWKFGEISYIKYGSGAPLLLLHNVGIGSAGHEWDNVLNALARHYTVYVPDMLGFGNSEKPEISYSAYLYASMINDFICDVVGAPVYLAASSKACDFAISAYRFQSENFVKMMLISPTGINGPAETMPCIKNLLDLPLYGTFAFNMMRSMAYISYYLKKQAYFDSSKIDLVSAAKYHKAAHFGGPSGKYPISACLAGLLSADISKTITELKIPVHIAWGAENEQNPINAVYDLNERGFNFGFTSFEKARLLPHSEHPSKFVKLCLEFFE